MINIREFSINVYGEKTLSSTVYGNNTFVLASAVFHFDSLNNVFATASYKSNTADFLYRHCHSTNYVWDISNFQSVLTTKLSVGATYFKRFYLSLNYFAVNNNVWIADNLLPEQKDGITNVLQAILKNRFKVGIFGFMGTAIFQYSNDDEAIRLPFFQIKQTAYLEFMLFNHRLKTQVGIDLFYNTAFYADLYLPEIGAFARQNYRKTGNYIYADLFLAANISRVNLFLSLSHAYAGLIGNDYFLTPCYPSEGLGLRFGVSWKFLD